MRNNVLVVRAIASEFAQRIYVPIAFVSGIFSVVLIGVSVWLTTLSAWWWILAVLVLIGVFIALAVLLIVRVIIATVRPSQNRTQQTAIKKFVDKLQNLSEITQTPKVVLLFRVVRDAVSSRKGGFVETAIGHTLSLRKDYSDLLELFSVKE